MNIQVKSEQQVLEEGFHILVSNMEASKVARFWAACNLGKGDYLKLKDELFGRESVESLSSKILKFQALKPEP
ncbi:hypothetical protein [Oscillatoria sp. FACHB-1406]|uniref:hypothetical protein n=1 Tax=Oscillatoria sp. FACHB-1406 TaxID=2692846 RepID=UPI001686AFA0|nr:hypothetical protein [Oscillatoria sp. FACHB-1406]MBD2578117.1 hypothetical protein [Oscillatoria sp. FACHB-1406]